MAVRVLSLMMGVWLFVSAFLWPHHGPVALSTWIPGLLIAAVALAALAAPPLRFVNAILGLWVLVAAVASGADDLVWSNGVAGLTVAVAAFVPTLPRRWGDEGRPAPARARA
jgi:hypothetical protein